MYFGTNSNVYANPKVVNNQLDTHYDPPGLLDSATSYYWVVDTYGSTPSPVPGDQWNFVTVSLPGDAVKLTEWKLENAYASGPDWMTSDTSGQGNDGTFVNPPVSGPLFSLGIDGNCLELTGDDDSVVKEDATFLPLNDSDPWTMNLYLYLTGKPDDWTRIANMGDDNYRQLFIYRNNEIGFLYQNKYLLLSGTTLDPDRWYMLTVPKPLRRFISQPLIAFGINRRRAHVGVPQRRPGQLTKDHRHKLIPATEALGTLFSIPLLDRTGKIIPIYQRKHLRK